MKLTLPHIEWNAISRQRGALMGFAMLIIVLFHVALPRQSHFFGLHRMGNIGVDMFFFLSGMGLWYAWKKLREKGEEGPAGGSLWHDYGVFMRRRLVRIYPAWLVMASLYYVPDYLSGGGKSTSVADLLGDIFLNWGFWQHDELTFWYIPAILMMYLWAPFYMELIRRNGDYRWLAALAVVWCVAVQWVTPVHQAVGHIEIFWSRIPIFLIGVNCGEWIRTRKCHSGTSWWLVLLLVLLPLATAMHMEQMHFGRFPLFICRMLYIPLTVGGSLILAHFIEQKATFAVRPLTFVGTISLEMYLVHANFVLPYLVPRTSPVVSEPLGYWPTALLCIAISLPLAWLLHIVLEPLIKKIA